MPEKKYNMDLYDEALVKIHPDERRTIFPMKLIGALSVMCPQDVWEDTIEMVLETCKKRDE